VSETEPKSPVEQLSDADKDALILRLWRDLQAARARSKELEDQLSRLAGSLAAAKAAPGGPLAELQSPGTGRRLPERATASARVPLGGGLGFLRSRFLVGAALLVALAFAADYAIGLYQHYLAEHKRLAALNLQHAAYEGLFVEVVNVAYESDEKSYRLTMKITNIEPGRPIYVMQSPVRVFEQSGLAWKEVPARAPNSETGSVVKLSGPHTYETIFEPNIKDWTELMPGYMHIRFESVSLVSERSDPDDDIVERTDRYYVYLKPHGADDDAIRRRMKYQGVPPVYMPMPPH
jgi:hypothetical protein